MVISTESKATLCIRCAVCGKGVPINEYEARYVTFKLCPECIEAIMWAKIQMKSANMNIVEDDGK